MQARMKNPAMIVPDAMPALQSLGTALGLFALAAWRDTPYFTEAERWRRW